MANHNEDVDRIIDDLRFIKAAIAKSSGIMRYMALSRTMRMVYLMMGLSITAFCGALYLLVQRYGSFAASPAWARVLLPGLSVVAFVSIAVYKIVGVFYFKDLAVGGDWLIATGLLILFLGERLDFLLGLILTFGLGFIAACVAGFIMARGEGDEGERCGRG